MEFDYNYVSSMGDEMGAAFGTFYIIWYLLSVGLGIACYVLRSLGLHSIAKRRGIAHPWLAWLPVADMWIVGSISDQYRYVTRGQIRNKRKSLVILQALMLVLIFALIVASFVGIMGMQADSMTATEEVLMTRGLSLILWFLLGWLAIFGVAIAAFIIHCMAMYDVYTSVNPPYSVAFLVLGIIFNFTEPFFIFFNRKKDGGMPPRCDIPAQTVQPAPQYLPPQQPIQEPWENVTEE